jgi:hypothetical protein
MTNKISYSSRSRHFFCGNMVRCPGWMDRSPVARSFVAHGPTRRRRQAHQRSSNSRRRNQVRCASMPPPTQRCLARQHTIPCCRPAPIAAAANSPTRRALKQEETPAPHHQEHACLFPSRVADRLTEMRVERTAVYFSHKFHSCNATGWMASLFV